MRGALRAGETSGDFSRRASAARCYSYRHFCGTSFPTAAYSQPGQFDADQTGIFWVNDLSLYQKTPAKKAAEVRQHFGLEFTCAHEAYPGHHLQFCIQNRHPSKLRRLFHHAIFYEGWTLWCEKMSVDQGVIDLPEARLIQLHDALWRAHRIVIDCGLHDGELSFAARLSPAPEWSGLHGGAGAGRRELVHLFADRADELPARPAGSGAPARTAGGAGWLGSAPLQRLAPELWGDPTAMDLGGGTARVEPQATRRREREEAIRGA